MPWVKLSVDVISPNNDYSFSVFSFESCSNTRGSFCPMIVVLRFDNSEAAMIIYFK